MRHARAKAMQTTRSPTRFGSEVCLLHVLEPIPVIAAFPAVPVAPSIPEVDFREQARAELEKLAQQEFPESVKTSLHLRDGVAYDEIASAAREMRVDLIIIATHGRTGLMHVLMGSTAERAMRRVRCSR